MIEYSQLSAYKVQSYIDFQSHGLAKKKEIIESIENLMPKCDVIPRKNPAKILQGLLLSKCSPTEQTFLLLKNAERICGYLLVQRPVFENNKIEEITSFAVENNNDNEENLRQKLLFDEYIKRADKAILEVRLGDRPYLEPFFKEFDIKEKTRMRNILARANVANDSFEYSKYMPKLVCNLIDSSDQYQPEDFVVETQNLHFSSGSCAQARGMRPAMEDTHCMETLFCNWGESDIYAVFDGAGGNNASHFMSEILPNVLKEKFQNLSLQELKSNGLIRKKIEEAFLKADELFKLGTEKSESSITTACVVIRIDQFLWIASVGDSRIISVSDESQMALTDDASVSSAYHCDLAKARHANIENNRISQIVGDSKMTVNYVSALGAKQIKALSALPEVLNYVVKENDRILILATDGFWDVCSVNRCGTLIRELLTPETTESDIAGALLKSAYRAQKEVQATYPNAKFGDNITVMVVRLNN